MGAAPAAGRRGVVASAHPEATRAGLEILRAGGNAMDAAVAVAFALSVVEPYSAGVGGGGFLLYRDAATAVNVAYDYREVAPKRAHRDMFVVDGKVDPKRSLQGMLSVGVPGMVPGLAEAQRRHGRLDLARCLEPAIRLAERGFQVLPEFHDASVHQLELLRAHPETARVFLKNGRPYAVGERLVQPDMARTLRQLAVEGPSLFTTGAVAQAIAKESQRLGGVLELSDLAAFRLRTREPLVGRYRGREIVTMPPPSSGGVHLLQILGLLERDRAQRGRAAHWLDPDGLHVLAESMRLAYADRAVHLGDPAFHAVPVAGLLAADYLDGRYRAVELARARPSSEVSAGAPAPREPADTTHFTIVDADGNAVACTQTINYGFGSGVVVPGTGVLLNDEMDDFAAAPGVPNVFGLVGGEANAVQPGKIPLSSMTPSFVIEDGRLRLAVGSPGGSTIITTVLQAIVHVLDHGLDLPSALATPRVHHQWLPDVLRLEPGAVPDGVAAALEARGHRLRRDRSTWGDATGIEIRPDGLRIGAADPRGDGLALAE
jgi:gamma-glutamyltranspeptidase/glutathione hydrolase